MSDVPTTPEPSPANFGGLRVASFESRRASDMQRLIERYGGQPFVSPSMREVAIEKNQAAIDFANHLLTGQIDVVIFMTGVGFRHLLKAVERHVDRERFLNSLSDVTTIARGPKPVVAMREAGLTPTHRVPEPNTWRELLQTVDAEVPVGNQSVGLLEYGISNTSLIAGLEARGARVENLRVYSWDFPEDTGPLESNIRRIVRGEIDVVMFTSANQVANVLRMADRMRCAEDLRRQIGRCVIASIGPTTSEMLLESDLKPDLWPEHPKMGSLVGAAAERSAGLLRQKRPSARAAAGALGDPPAWEDSPFMRACRLEPTDVTPVWLMRQAGRYMREYREVRARTSFLGLCKNPQLCCEVMLAAVERLGVDAAIIFSDLPLIFEPMGLELEYTPGPVVHNPVRDSADVDRVRELEVPSMDYVYQAVRLTRESLPERLPLIGFAGAPFTLASYAIEGGASRHYLATKQLMYGDPGAWHELLGKFSRAVAGYLNAQIDAGAQCVQLFDSWAGCLHPADYRTFVLPHVEAIIASLPEHTPVINFATGNPQLLPQLAEAQPAVVGVDWRIELAEAWRTIGPDFAVQGNLDPTVLLAETDVIVEHTKRLLEGVAGRPGHIFNLGHGILPQTPVDNAIALVDIVHELTSR